MNASTGLPKADDNPAIEVRHGASVVARAAALGTGVGAALGCLIPLPEFVRSIRDTSSIREAMTDSWLPVAAAIGAAVGILSAVIASAGWLVTMLSAPHRPRRVQAVGAACAAAVTFIVSVATLSAVTWFGGAGALTAALVAYFAAPHVGLRR